MNEGSWLSGIIHAGRLFFESVPEATWLAYEWAREWQGLLGGLLLVLAAWIFARGSMRAARIRAAALIRSAEIAATTPLSMTAQPAPIAARAEPVRQEPASPQSELLQRVEQLRSLIRSAMSTLTSDAGRVSTAPNFYCERITLMRFDDTRLPPSLTPAVRDLHKKMVLALAHVRQATEKKVSQAELSQVLVQLNARARELANALAPAAVPSRQQASGGLRKP